ncbi:MAG: tRNA (adenosine(37)-N6)-dimethylallyltransferase MiaA [Kiritimatiellae bacterium]|jgi:tRNA dimethylallyltransferase|nr:tRNA (adenosine(37)-N6)-dimethylallyltransferase MiaA [Kiritimatiellia bacterium]
MSVPTPLYLLSGPTASGKTGFAHLLADRLNLRLLSVDSMMVYRGMDIGTAKPTPDEIACYEYAGLNLADPGENFSTGHWLRAISSELDERPTLAVGGTGLYFRALTQGLSHDDPDPVSDTDLDVDTLRRRIRERDPEMLDQLADPHNPRRLERALARLEAGQPPPDHWKEMSLFPIPVLRREVSELNERILQRTRHMFAEGLLEETRHLLEAETLTGTAGQAIGYAEATSVLRGESSVEQAGEAVSTRTRRYAKRQRTWFRNQMDARWVDVTDQDDPQLIADRLAEIWQDTGPFLFDRGAHV